MKKIAVYVGRFAPFHNGHLFTIREALAKYDHVRVLVGSSSKSINPRTPWNSSERFKMVSDAVRDLCGISIETIRDYPEDDDEWVEQVKRATIQSFAGNTEFKDAEWYIIGSPRDAETTKYLSLLCQKLNFIPDFTPTEVSKVFLSGTQIRELIFKTTVNGAPVRDWKALLNMNVPISVYIRIMEYITTLACHKITAWLDSIEMNEALFRAGARTPVYVTTDAVVTRGFQVLCIVRKGKQGQGQWAIPGGFLEADLTLIENIKKEVMEETGILVQDPLRHEIYDAPDRSVRGRTVDHVFAFDVDEDVEPQGGDDAAIAKFIHWHDLPSEDMWFEDHYRILMKMKEDLEI